MVWRENLRPASFRGVAFLVEEGAKSGGRRLAQHEFPGRDVPYNEDLGRSAREFPVEAYVLGADYMAKRDALEAALEKAGPGKLVHHWRGELDVVVSRFRVTESTREGGMARFSITFHEQGENLYPQASINTASVVRAETDNTIAAAGSRFEEVFKAASNPSFLADLAEADVVKATDAMLREARKLIAEPAEFARFTRSIAGLKSSAGSLIASPGDLFTEISGSLRSLTDMSFVGGLPLSGAGGTSASRTQGALVALQGFGDELSSVDGATPGRTQAGANRAAFTDAIADVAAAEEARLASATAFGNAGDARAMRDDMAGRLAARAERAGDTGADGVYYALNALRVSVNRHLGGMARTLPGVSTFRPLATEPALAISNRLYGDDPAVVAARAADIAARNHVRHPGFVRGGEPIEVIAP